MGAERVGLTIGFGASGRGRAAECVARRKSEAQKKRAGRADSPHDLKTQLNASYMAEVVVNDARRVDEDDVLDEEGAARVSAALKAKRDAEAEAGRLAGLCLPPSTLRPDGDRPAGMPYKA